jgi:hypothetical protein
MSTPCGDQQRMGNHVERSVGRLRLSRSHDVVRRSVRIVATLFTVVGGGATVVATSTLAVAQIPPPWLPTVCRRPSRSNCHRFRVPRDRRRPSVAARTLASASVDIAER